MHGPDGTKEVSEKRAPSLRLRVGAPVSTGLCKRRAKPESGPRETGRRSSSEGNSSYPTSPACPLRQDFASAGPESEAHSSNSPGTGQNHNFFDINMLEIQGLPGDTNLASPGKWLFATILTIKWLQIKCLPGDLHEHSQEDFKCSTELTSPAPLPCQHPALSIQGLCLLRRQQAS